MKKFLSLALALIMTLSLVTISAGATEYKDFTDKGEIQYEEAVAVLNRLGIITGYETGDFRPEGELTRGAAAKIIVSLLIGPEAAEALPTDVSPYPDVPVGNVFAGYISFCKNSGIISGYNDGTFRPTGTLTGYAFSKMLLGALGYDSDIEKFTGSGWTVRVASIGGAAGLFDRISFKGGETVNRETACQLALNTLKATMVEYTGGSNVTVSGPEGTNVSVSTDKTCKYVTSNQDFATNIKGNENDYVGTGNGTGNDRNWADWYTVEFGEEHFVDLKLEHSKYRPTEDKFGRPSVEWSYKRVTIGTYPLEADYTYTTQVAHDVPETTDAAKVRALELGDYKVTNDTAVFLNGRDVTGQNLITKVADIADYTDNGALVEVYISYKNADEISHVVVSQSQLMEVKRVGTNAVSLQMWDDNSRPDQNVNRDDGSKLNDGQSGYNQDAIYAKIEDVETNDDYFTMLSGMKSGDLVVVVPVAKDPGQKATDDYEVGEAYVPESVSGAFTNVTTHGSTGSNTERRAIAVTVGGTKYNVSQWHNEDLGGANSDTLKITRGDVTLYMDKYGNAMLGKNFGDASGWLIVGAFRQTLTDGRLTTLVTGWDESGNKLELNLGPNNNLSGNRYTTAGATIVPGDLVRYTSTTNSSITDWAIFKDVTRGVYNVYTEMSNVANELYSVKASNPNIRLYDYNDGKNQVGPDPANNPFGVAKMSGTVKFVFVNFDEDGEVSSVNVQKQTNVSNAELVKVNPHITGGSAAQAGVKDDDTKVVVIKNDYTDVNSLYLGYISKYIGQATLSSSMTNTKNDANSLTASNLKNDTRVIHEYTAVMRNTDGHDGDEVTVYSYDRLNPGDFFYWTKRDVEGFDNFYDLRRPNELTGRNTTVMWATLNSLYNGDKNVLRVQDYIYSKAANDNATIKMYPAVATQKMSDLDHGEFANTLNVSGAVWHDLTNNRINNATDLKSYLTANDGSNGQPARTVKLRMVVNDNPESDGFRDVYLIVIESTPTKASVGADIPASEIPIYADYVQKGDKAPDVDVDEADKYELSLPENSWTEIVIDGETYKYGDKLPTLGTAGTIKVKPAAGWEIKGATADADGFYTVEVSKTNNTVKLTEVGSAQTGNITVKMDAKYGTASVTSDAIKSQADLTLTLKAPEWAALGSTTIATGDVTDIKYTINVNDTPVKKGTITVSGNFTPDATTNSLVQSSGKIVLHTGIGSDSAPVFYLGNEVDDLTKDAVEIVITDVTWKNAKVDFVMGSETIGTGSLAVAQASATGSVIHVDLGDKYKGDFTYTVDGATLSTNSNTGTGTETETYDAAAIDTTAKWCADGGKKVTVTITGLKDNEDATLKFSSDLKVTDSTTKYLVANAAEYNLSKVDSTYGTALIALKLVKDADGSAIDGTAFATGAQTGIAKDTAVKLQLVVAANGETKISSYDFKIYLSNKTDPLEVKGVACANGTTDVPNGKFYMTEDVTVTKIEVTPTAAVKFTSTDTNNVNIPVFNFDGALNSTYATYEAVEINDVAETDDSNVVVGLTNNDQGLQVRIKDTSSLTRGDKISLADGSLKAADGKTNVDVTGAELYWTGSGWSKTAPKGGFGFEIAESEFVFTDFASAIASVKDAEGNAISKDGNNKYAVAGGSTITVTYTLKNVTATVGTTQTPAAAFFTVPAADTAKANCTGIKLGATEGAAAAINIENGKATIAGTDNLNAGGTVLTAGNVLVVTYTTPSDANNTEVKALTVNQITFTNAVDKQ